jgi:hypothetical protein
MVDRWNRVTILFIIGSLRSSAGVLTTLVFTALVSGQKCGPDLIIGLPCFGYLQHGR